MKTVLNAAVITVSDSGYRGEREDASGPALGEILEKNGWTVVHRALVPDDVTAIQEELKRCADELGVGLVLTTGGTGFASRDVTPEATLAVLDRTTPGIPEAMRAASLRITPRGCLSRAVAGSRKETLIVNLPGSPKAAVENLEAVLPALDHAVEMLRSGGSANCAADATTGATMPSASDWLRAAKAEAAAADCGMYLIHNGVVRATSREAVREGRPSPTVRGLRFSWDPKKVAAAEERARTMPGIRTVKVWLNRGELAVGEDLMLVLVGGNIRPRVFAALESLLAELKDACVTETELFD